MKNHREDREDRRMGEGYQRNAVRNILKKIKTAQDIYEIEDEITVEERREHIDSIRKI